MQMFSMHKFLGAGLAPSLGVEFSEIGLLSKTKSEQQRISDQVISQRLIGMQGQSDRLHIGGNLIWKLI